MIKKLNSNQKHQKTCIFANTFTYCFFLTNFIKQMNIYFNKTNSFEFLSIFCSSNISWNILILIIRFKWVFQFCLSNIKFIGNVQVFFFYHFLKRCSGNRPVKSVKLSLSIIKLINSMQMYLHNIESHVCILKIFALMFRLPMDFESIL